MKIDGGLANHLADSAESARAAERVGYDGVFSPETNHDPFLPLVSAASATSRIELGTGIAVAFSRNPMTLAVLANDLQLHSEGRFILGLGSQIKAHIEKRFSMPWSHPADRMRELVLAIRAVWACWNEDVPLDFRGDFYTHTLMTPFFNPGRNPFGPPKVFLAAVGQRMTEVTGEVADGMLVHAFTTEKYLRQHTLPAIERGLAASGRTREDFQVSYPGFVVTGRDEAEMAEAAASVRKQIAFYGSTPAYRPVLEAHGWGDAQTELNVLSKRGEWTQMADVIDDEMLNTFAAVGSMEEIPKLLHARYGDIVDRISFYTPYEADPEHWASAIEGLRHAGATAS